MTAQTSKTVKIIDQAHYTFIQNISTGINPFNHIASIRIDKKDTRVFAKYFYPHTKKLVNEITGYIIARALNIPTAEKACIIRIEKHIIEEQLGQKIDTPANIIPLWCVSQINGRTPNQIYSAELAWQNPVFTASLQRWPKLPDLIAFDDWVANNDRNTGNMIKTGRDTYSVFDHDHIFNSPAWTHETLPHNLISQNKIVDGILGGDPSLPIKNKVAHITQEHLSSFTAIESELLYWWQLLLNKDEFNAARQFVYNRARYYSDRLKSRYQLII